MLVLELDGDLAAGVAPEEGDAGRRRRCGLRREERAHAQHDAHRLRGGRGGSSGCGGGRHRRGRVTRGLREAAGVGVGRVGVVRCDDETRSGEDGDRWGRGPWRQFEFEHGWRRGGGGAWWIRGN